MKTFALHFTHSLILICIYGVPGITSQQPTPPKPSDVICTADSLLFYQDCRMCTCPKADKLAQCFRKTCDLRTKDSGQCPVTILRLDDSRLCTPQANIAGCRTDSDCKGPQLCCFDFCGGPKCMNPVPLDALSGYPTHHGRGYQ